MTAMTFTPFASGSTGNCALLSLGDVHILVDAGISARRIRQALAHWGLAPGDLTAVVVTHDHSDHISGLPTLTALLPDLPLFASRPVTRQLCRRMAVERRTHPFDPGDSFSLKSLRVDSIPTSHDTPGSVGYRFTAPDGRSACVVTDLGVVTEPVRQGVVGVRLAAIECNHDPDLLRSGPYPYYLKQRILGPQGHLSNEDGALLCAHAVQNGARTLLLSHISQQNNTPLLARNAVCRALSGAPAVTVAAAPVLDWTQRYEV